MLAESASGASDDSRSVRLVNYGKGSGLAADRKKAREIENVAIHGKHAVGNGDEASRRILECGYLFFQIFHVRMAVNDDLRAREPAPVYDGRVVEFVGKHRVALPRHRRHHADVGHVARRVQDRRLRALEGRDAPFKGNVRTARAGKKTRSAGPRPPATQRFLCGAYYLRILRNAEVVVGRKNSFEIAFAFDTLAREPGRIDPAKFRLDRFLRRRTLPGGRRKRRALDDDSLLFEIADRRGNRVAGAGIDEDASAARIAGLLHDAYAAIAYGGSGDVAGNVSGIVRNAYLPDDSGSGRDLGSEDDGFGEMVLAGRARCGERRVRIHAGRSDAALAVRLQTLQRRGIDQHRPAHRMRSGEHLHHLPRSGDARAL